MTNKTYTEKDIKVLSDREHVRYRLPIYAGSTEPTEYKIPLFTETDFRVDTVTFIPAVYKVIGEVLDNALDEFAHLTSKVKLLKITADPSIGKYTISDNGRGIPIGKHETGKYTPEVVLASLRSGRNFTSDKQIGVLGMNGIGVTMTNFTSDSFEVTINRDDKQYYQKFTDGAAKISTPKITPSKSQSTGTEVSFQLDPVVFKNVAMPETLIHNRAIEIAATNPDVTVEYNGTRYRYKRGLLDLVVQTAVDKSFHCFTINEPTVTGEIYVIFNATTELDEQMYTWVNSSLLFDGGKCNTQFFNAFFDKAIDHLAKDAKKAKAEVTRNDVRRGLMVLANLKIKNPEYDSQSKTRLTGPDIRKEIVSSLDESWKSFIKHNTGWLEDVLSYAIERHHRDEDNSAVTEHEKDKKKRFKAKNLLDATNTNRSLCKILITEGDSAKSQISEARDPKTIAAYALTGKINNVLDSTPAQVLKMEKIKELLLVIGLTPGKKAVRSDLNYGQVVIATDADYDGDDIFTLLVNLFYRFWPELMDPNYEPFVYRLIAPNVCLVKGKQRIHFPNRADYDKNKHKYKGYEVNYFKGLGSMTKQDWEMILSGETDTYIPIVSNSQMVPTMKLLFSDDADARKVWLTTKE